jgi:predicted RNase H-like HicB family nuclease
LGCRARQKLRTYIAIAEPSDDGKTWWISFPRLPGVTSAAEGPEHIARQARDALISAIDAGAAAPPAIEDGVTHAYDLGEYENPLVVLAAYEPAVAA